jgi:hypothetical protein
MIVWHFERVAKPWRPSKAPRVSVAGRSRRRDSRSCASASRARGIDVQNLRVETEKRSPSGE